MKTYGNYKDAILTASTDEAAYESVEIAYSQGIDLGSFAKCMLEGHLQNEKCALLSLPRIDALILDPSGVERMQWVLNRYGLAPIDVNTEMEAHKQLLADREATIGEWVPAFRAAHGPDGLSTASWEAVKEAQGEAVRKLREKRQQ